MLKLDHFVHIVNCRAENFKVTLASSLKYTGMSDEPPRLMEEGFVILSSNTIDFYYYMDEPGLVPEVPLMVELANGDVVECSAPMWGLDIRCGKAHEGDAYTFTWREADGAIFRHPLQYFGRGFC